MDRWGASWSNANPLHQHFQMRVTSRPAGKPMVQQMNSKIQPTDSTSQRYEVPLTDGPFDAMVLAMQEAPKTELGLPIDGNGVPTNDAPFGLAIYVRDSADQFKFSRFETKPDEVHRVIFADGPAASDEPPPCQLPAMMIVPLLDDSTVFKGNVSADPTAAAVYQLKPVNSVWKYFLVHVDRSADTVSDLVRDANEMRARSAARAFYKAPNYDIYSMKPTGEHVQVPIEVGYRRGHVDEQIAGVIKRLWSIDLDTLGSCQSRPAGSKHPHEAYVQFPLQRHAKVFQKVLQQSSVECSFESSTMKLRSKDSTEQNPQELTLEVGTVFFATSDLTNVELALDSWISQLDNPQ